jgi:hypothetical protein
MDEDIVTVLLLDEAIALGPAEPLHPAVHTFCHDQKTSFPTGISVGFCRSRSALEFRVT